MSRPFYMWRCLAMLPKNFQGKGQASREELQQPDNGGNHVLEQNSNAVTYFLVILDKFSSSTERRQEALTEYLLVTLPNISKETAAKLAGLIPISCRNSIPNGSTNSSRSSLKPSRTINSNIYVPAAWKTMPP